MAGYKEDNGKIIFSITPLYAWEALGQALIAVSDETLDATPERSLQAAWQYVIDGLYVSAATAIAIAISSREELSVLKERKHWHVPQSVLSAVYNVMLDPVRSGRYVANDWQHVRPVIRYVDAALRHLFQRFQGEVLDVSGQPHISHALASLLIVIHQQQRGLPLGEYTFK